MFLRLKMPHPAIPWPTTAKSALIQNVAYYNPPANERVCAHDKMYCKHRCSDERNIQCDLTLYFTIDEIPICLSWSLAYNEFMDAQHRGDPMDANTAIEQGKDYYFVSKPGKTCGHVGKRTLGGQCYICSEMRLEKKRNTSRAVAIKTGKIWYMPAEGKLCKNGHHAERRVSNGSCRQCEAEALTVNPSNTRNETSIHRLMPDMVISRGDAKIAGFKVYRTGKACRAGHTGWRYVSTLNCLECMGRK